jgi:hypothetical protein
MHIQGPRKSLRPAAMETAAVVAVHCILARASAGRATGGLMVMESVSADAPVAPAKALSFHALGHSEIVRLEVVPAGIGDGWRIKQQLGLYRIAHLRRQKVWLSAAAQRVTSRVSGPPG